MATNLFKESNYIQVPGFAVVRLKLSGNELLCFSLIYGFSQDGDSDFHGSLAYIASALNVTRQNALRILQRLVEKGLIVKQEIDCGGVKFCHYVHNDTSVAESATGCYQNSNTPPVIKTATHNTDTNDKIKDNKVNIDNTAINIEQPSIFQDIDIENRDRKRVIEKEREKMRSTSEPRECLFVNSRYFDFEKFCSAFASIEYEQVDLRYYYESVRDWSAQKESHKKKDWIATARNWIRADKQKKCLHTITHAGLTPDAIKYLQDMAPSDFELGIKR